MLKSHILDWSDTGECHENDGVHRRSGRIYKITYGEPAGPAPVDLARLSTEELVRLQLDDNEWCVRMARWELRERKWRDGITPAAMEFLLELVGNSSDISHQRNLRQTLHWLGAYPDAEMNDPFSFQSEPVDESIKALMFQLTLLNSPVHVIERQFAIDSENSVKIGAITRGEESPAMRLKWASMLQRLPVQARVNAARGLVSHAQDATDHNLPLMIWYGIRDLPSSTLAGLFRDCRIPLVKRHLARRVTEEILKDSDSVNRMLEDHADADASDLLAGMRDALKGWRSAPKPAAWDSFARKHPSESRGMGIVFGCGEAIELARSFTLDPAKSAEERISSLQSLIDAGIPGLQQLCESLIEVDALSLTAIRGLAQFDDPSIAGKIISRFPRLASLEKPHAVEVLASRPGSAKGLLTHLNQTIAREEVSAATARQIRAFNDPVLNRLLAESWGGFGESNADRAKLVESLKAKLTPGFISRGDPKQGRRIFSHRCSACHKLYGEGSSIGPDLTGSGRHDIGYLIENLADPSAIVAADYALNVITLKDGRVISGTISSRSARTLTIRTAGIETTIERDQIIKQEQLSASMMPEGLLDSLGDPQLAHLMSYLMGDRQVPLPENQASE